MTDGDVSWYAGVPRSIRRGGREERECGGVVVVVVVVDMLCRGTRWCGGLKIVEKLWFSVGPEMSSHLLRIPVAGPILGVHISQGPSVD